MTIKKILILYIILIYTGFFVNAQSQLTIINIGNSFNGYELGSKYNKKNDKHSLHFENNYILVDYGTDSIIKLPLTKDTIELTFNLFYFNDSLKRIGVFFNGSFAYNILYNYLNNQFGNNGTVSWDFSKNNLTTITWKLENSIVLLISDDVFSGGKLIIIDKSLYTLDNSVLKNIVIDNTDKSKIDLLFK